MGLGEVEDEDSGQQILKIGKEYFSVSTHERRSKVTLYSNLNQLSNSASRTVGGAPSNHRGFRKNYKYLVFELQGIHTQIENLFMFT